MARAGAAIVTWNSEGQLGPCLEALRRHGVRQIVVVDNASRDGTVEEARRFGASQLIVNPWNRGFAGALNQAIEIIESPLVLVINPDCELLGGLDALEQACAQPSVAATGGKLLDGLGRPQVGFMVRRFPTPAALALEVLGINRLWWANPVNRRYRCLDLDPEQPGEVEQPAGAFLMVRRQVWRELGGFAECFHPLWFEDVDWLLRAARAGYRIRYEPRAVARHRGAGSISKLGWEERQWYWYDSLFRFAGRHFRPLEYRILLAVAEVGFALRGAGGIRQAGGAALRVYGRIMRLAAKEFMLAARKRGHWR
ncbi:MAG: glycosyltransferase family 2 protein [Bryobacterales bacterium]|nr:glycosyltransferase [Bryobacteraceae bacterium]MDW8130203.1 glycosyltransferase family 2 protein [Bryobacterales bacterium]